MTDENALSSTPLIEMRGISKSFGGVHANADVELVLGAGEILGLLGENGAGKTTLMNILFGVYQADHGTIAVEGKPVRIQSAADALATPRKQLGCSLQGHALRRVTLTQ
jgi:simple sugar transport system ATP-binding protein